MQHFWWSPSSILDFFQSSCKSTVSFCPQNMSVTTFIANISWLTFSIIPAKRRWYLLYSRFFLLSRASLLTAFNCKMYLYCWLLLLTNCCTCNGFPSNILRPILAAFNWALQHISLSSKATRAFFLSFYKNKIIKWEKLWQMCCTIARRRKKKLSATSFLWSRYIIRPITSSFL